MIRMANNKIVYAGKVLIDLTGLTVTPETLAEGVIAMNAKGEIIVGTAKFADNNSTAILGKAKLGEMILGKE